MSEKIFEIINQWRDPQKALVLQKFFKTGPGEYGEGDIFWGVPVPEQKKIAREFKDADFDLLKKMMQSKVHDHRSIALLILIDQYQKGSEFLKKEIFNFYCSQMDKINNWDLVDISAAKIIGDYLYNRSRRFLFKLAKSQNLWFRRISIISTHYFIRQNDLEDSLKISSLLIKDNHDLIHKAVGWTLREVGKKDVKALEDFLENNYRIMPRVMLRYAIEKFPEKKRKYYLKKQ